MNKKSKVAILGYGEMGHAMQQLLQAQHEIYIWDKQPQNNIGNTTLEAIIPQADFVFFCLPVNPHREIATRIKLLVKPGCICLSIAKGLDESGNTAAQVFQQVFGDPVPYVLIYGPMISEEIRAGRYAFAQLGCIDLKACEHTHRLFQNTRLKLEVTSDISGISWSVILKNVYALLFGMADGAQLGDNVRGFLAVEALRELDKIAQQMGGKASSVYGLAGLGDLMTTATSEGSHHHSLGCQLARGEAGDIAGEGVHTLAMVDKYQILTIADFPLFELAYDIMNNPVNIKEKLLAYIDNK